MVPEINEVVIRLEVPEEEVVLLSQPVVVFLECGDAPFAISERLDLGLHGRDQPVIALQTNRLRDDALQCGFEFPLRIGMPAIQVGTAIAQCPAELLALAVAQPPVLGVRLRIPPSCEGFSFMGSAYTSAYTI